VDIAYDRLDLAADVDRDDVGALLGQTDRVRSPQAADRTRDEGDLRSSCPVEVPLGNGVLGVRADQRPWPLHPFALLNVRQSCPASSHRGTG